MKFVAIADTHGQHRKLNLPPGDVLLHAGDVSRRGEESEIQDFLDWFSSLDFEHKIFIAGNHDFFFERSSPENVSRILPANVTYLCDSGTIINGIRIWGSPVTPWFHDWAFNRERGEEILKHWQRIPADTDILMTHGPVFSRLDETVRGEHVGCEDLLRVVEQIKPKVYLCGHIHEAYGQTEDGGTTFINASVLNVRYAMTNEPVVFEI